MKEHDAECWCHEALNIFRKAVTVNGYLPVGANRYADCDGDTVYRALWFWA